MPEFTDNQAPPVEISAFLSMPTLAFSKCSAMPLLKINNPTMLMADPWLALGYILVLGLHW